MELCSQPESTLVNNNDLKHIQDEKVEENCDAEKNSIKAKAIDAKRQSTTDEEGDINCSIVPDQASSTPDSSIKITFKLQKKDKSAKTMSKNKNKSNNTREKVNKLVIKDTHGQFSIKSTDKGAQNDLEVECQSTSQLDKQTELMADDDPKQKGALSLRKEDLENEKCNTSLVSNCSSDLKSHSSESSCLSVGQNHPTSTVMNTSIDSNDIPLADKDGGSSITKRKPKYDPCSELLKKNYKKTDSEDCNEKITPLTKRRKVFEDNSENSDTEAPLLNTHDEVSKLIAKENSIHDIQSSSNKRELDSPPNEIEPKTKKIKTIVSESFDEKVKTQDSHENIDSSIKYVSETSLSEISIEIPDNKTKNLSSSCNESKTKLEEKSPTVKSPKDAKKITLEDFLKELNEESKNIKEGDEIPDSDDHEISDDVGCVIVKQREKSEQGDEKDSREECDSQDISETSSKPNESNSELSHKEKCLNTIIKTSCSVMKECEGKLLNEETSKHSCKAEIEDLEEIQSDVSSVKETPKSEHNDLPSIEDKKSEKVRSCEEDAEKVKHGRENFDSKITSSEPNDKSKNDDETLKKGNEEFDSTEKISHKKNENSSKELSKQSPKNIEDRKSSDESDSSDATNTSDESSSSGSESSDSDSSSDSESGSDSSDSESSDSEKKKEPEKTVVHPKKLKIRNAPSLSQDSVHKSDSSSSTQDSAEKASTAEISNKPVVSTTETLSQQILAGSSGTTPAPVKKKRGRPRKYPLPDPVSEVTLKTEVIIESEVTVKSEPSDEPPPDDTVESLLNIEEEKVPKKRGRKPGFKLQRGRKPGRKKKIKKPRKHYQEYKQQKQQLALLKKEEESSVLIPTTPVPNDSSTPVIKRKRGRPKKIKDPEPSTSDQNVPRDALSEQLLELNSHLNEIVSDIPEINPGEDNSNEITDNRLLEEINSGLDVITEEIVSEDVSNYLHNPLDDALQYQEPKKEIKVEEDDYNAYDDYDNYNQYERPKKKVGRPRKYPKKIERRLKTEDPNYHKKYYKYVKIPKDQQKKRGPKKREDSEIKPEKIRRHKPGKIGRPRKRDLGAVDRREERHDDSDHPYDESLSKELESVNRSMENILTEQDNDDKDFTVSHLKFEQLSEDQLKRSNRPKKSDVGMFSDFDNQIDELIEMAATEVQDRPKPKYRYYERIPKHLQKKRGRPRKTEDPNAPPRPPKPKKEKPPKPKKTIMVKKMVTDPETGEEVEVETEEVVEDNENDYIDFDEEDEYEEDIDDEDKDKDFDIQDYLKKGKNGIDNNLEYEEVYPTKEKMFKPKKTLKNYRSIKAHHARFNRFGKFGNKIRSMMPARRNMNACDFRYVTVYDSDYNPIAKVQRMYCIKVAPATYDIADKYRPQVKVRNLDYDDVNEFFDKYWCDLCEISFLETKINKRRHEYIFHTEEIECDLCDRTVSNRYNLRKHREIFHQKKVYTCKVCEEEYRKFRSFQMHVWEAHPDATGKNRAYFCNICQTVFYRRASFKFHYFEHLNGNIFAQFDTSLSDIEFLLKQLMY